MRLPIAFAAAIAALPAAAFELAWPVACELGETCHIQHLVDLDPGPGVRDFACGTLSYDGHKGTDIALPTLADMGRGVPVLAAAPGRVAGMRNSMPDRVFRSEDEAALDGRDCGNGVVIRHADGFETQYCHLRQGSVRVRMGDAVATGDPLGEIGLSGRTQFPHLHLSVRKDGNVVDPFAPGGDDCGGVAEAAGLWADKVPYRPGALLDLGFAPGVPGYADVKSGTAGQSALAADAPGIVLFAFAFAGQKGDAIRFEIEGPEGELLNTETVLDKPQARFFRAAGKKLKASRWPAGTYTGTASFLRSGKVLDRRNVQVIVE